eukprot:3631815-Prymnesium_polylepis.1
MEAIVRLSLVIALPTDAELELLPDVGAAEFIMKLRFGKEEYKEFVEMCDEDVGGSITDEHFEPRQHVSRCVHHFMMLVTKIIALNVHGSKDAPVDEPTIKEFMKRLKYGDPPLQHHLISSQLMRQELVKSVEDAYNILRDKLRGVKVFAGLSDDDIELLQSSMTNVPFRKYEDVITQGDMGDTFFVITSGHAEVVRVSEDELKGNSLQVFEKKLSDLHAYNYFGERALLKSEPRMATVRAVTDLETVCITGHRFEQVFGRPLSYFVPDTEYDLTGM